MGKKNHPQHTEKETPHKKVTFGAVKWLFFKPTRQKNKAHRPKKHKQSTLESLCEQALREELSIEVGDTLKKKLGRSPTAEEINLNIDRALNRLKQQGMVEDMKQEYRSNHPKKR